MKFISLLTFIIPFIAFSAKPPLDDFRYIPNWQGYVNVEDGHQLYCERIGNPNGVSTIFLTGGPTRSFTGHHRKIFNLSHYNVVFCDQRGLGLSRYQDLLKSNTTQFLVDDIERIRSFFGFDRIFLVSESWGTTLALVYAIKNPEKVRGMLMASTFLAREQDIKNFLKDDSKYMNVFKNYLPSTERGTPFEAYADKVLSDASVGPDGKDEVAKHFMYWLLGSQAALAPNVNTLKYEIEAMNPKERLKIVKVKLHYIKNNFFLEKDYISNHKEKIQGIPMIFLHGRLDRVSNYFEIRKLVVGSSMGGFFPARKAGHSFESKWMFPLFRSMANSFYSNLLD